MLINLHKLEPVLAVSGVGVMGNQNDFSEIELKFETNELARRATAVRKRCDFRFFFEFFLSKNFVCV